MFCRGTAPLTLLFAAALIACGDETEDLRNGGLRDAATSGGDDTGAGRSDTGAIDPDGGEAGPDGGTSVTDGGEHRPDATTTPLEEGVAVLDVGPIETGPSGETPPITFELPADTVSFMVLLSGTDPDASYIVTQMDGPDGVIVSDDESNVSQIEALLLGPFAAQFKGPNRVVQDVDISAALVPNNPNITVRGGTYTMRAAGIRIQGQQSEPYVGPINVGIQYRTIEPAEGYLDVNLYFTGAGGVTADSAPTDQLVQGALEELGRIYAQASVEIGDVAYYDVPETYRTISVSLDGSPGALEAMFQETAGRGSGLHFFFVDRFEGGFPGAMIGGIAGGLPGPARMPGSVNSGVAVAITAAEGDAGTLAHIMAHEGGHWLGLFHTSEITGTEDQLPDTPAGQAGETHLMYPAVGGGTTLSESQSTVIRHHIETIRK